MMASMPLPVLFSHKRLKACSVLLTQDCDRCEKTSTFLAGQEKTVHNVVKRIEYFCMRCHKIHLYNKHVFTSLLLTLKKEKHVVLPLRNFVFVSETLLFFVNNKIFVILIA